MDVHKDFIPRVKEEKHPNDKSFSHTGNPDFTNEAPEIVSLKPLRSPEQVRTRKSLNNSYT